jgi:hypothetical protein
MKKKILFFLITLFLITGCETKVTGVLHKNDTQITIIRNTQRGQIVNSLDTIAMINATYLNPVLQANNKDVKKYEIFVVGVYNTNDAKAYDKSGIHNPNYSITMNNSNYEKAEKADAIKLQLQTYPFYNPWMKYYVVYFPKTDNNILTLTYTNKLFGKTTLTFKKSINQK